jgi:hypothetical protein
VTATGSTLSQQPPDAIWPRLRRFEDDVEFGDDLVIDLLFDLAYPEMHGVLTPERVQSWIGGLEKARRPHRLAELLGTQSDGDSV